KYARIAAEGNKTWYFEGSTLRMHLRSPSILVVSFVDVTGSVSSEIKMAAGSQRTLLFINTTTSLDDLITQEKTRQHELYRDILLEGPNFSSEHYGTLYFTEGGEFRWDDYDLLIPSILPVAVLGRGRVETKYFLANSLKNDYAGVLTMILKTIGGPDQTVNFLYSLDSGGGLGGLRLEYLPQWCLEDNTAVVKDNSPTVMYFYQVE
ncbi:MAG: SH3 domain-containing protein, partial [Spirochaetaceae bacterium]|nr:SH3 domain-containing protein [Spirochaetaceae bacterium]